LKRSVWKPRSKSEMIKFLQLWSKGEYLILNIVEVKFISMFSFKPRFISAQRKTCS